MYNLDRWLFTDKIISSHCWWHYVRSTYQFHTPVISNEQITTWMIRDVKVIPEQTKFWILNSFERLKDSTIKCKTEVNYVNKTPTWSAVLLELFSHPHHSFGRWHFVLRGSQYWVKTVRSEARYWHQSSRKDHQFSLMASSTCNIVLQY